MKLQRQIARGEIPSFSAYLTQPQLLAGSGYRSLLRAYFSSYRFRLRRDYFFLPYRGSGARGSSQQTANLHELAVDQIVSGGASEV